MTNLDHTDTPPNPADRYAYIDKAVVWLQSPLPQTDQQMLRERCGTGGLHVHNVPMRFNRTWNQRLQLRQPKRDALQWLSRRNDVLLNAFELSLDWVFNGEADRDAASEFIRARIVKSHHRDQGIRYAGTGTNVTRYSGPRSAPNVITIYSDRPSKVTGEVDCVHIEWRTSGVEACRRAGFSSLADLMLLDHRQFWDRRLLLYKFDRGKLGRAYWRHMLGQTRRKGWIRHHPSGFIYDKDRSAGSVIIRALGSTQAVIDRHGREFDLKPAMVVVARDHLLPSESGHTLL